MFKVLNDNIAIKEAEKKQTSSGIVIADIRYKEPIKGEVVEIGDEVTKVKKKEKIVFEAYNLSPVEINGGKYYFVKEKEVKAIIE